MNRIRSGMRRGRDRGNMPFALVAITVLLLASAYGVVAARAEEAGERTGNVGTEIDLIDESAGNIRRFIERGLGEIVFGISTDRGLGGMAERSEAFGARAADWLDFQFPAEDSGVRATIKSYDLALGSEKLRAPGALSPAEGYVPAYLVAEGTVTAVFESDTGRSERTLGIRSDGSCALPLALSAGSMFSEAVNGEGSVIGQMMTYQLAALAQTRVLNGYGASARYGERSVDAILTAEDARQAYRNALSAAEAIYFRSTDDGSAFEGEVDMAKAFVAPDGYVEVDLNAVYSQMLSAHSVGIADHLFDYFLGNKALRAVDGVEDGLRNAWGSFTSWLTGRDAFSAAPYIREVLPDGDFDLRSGEFFLLEAEVNGAPLAIPVPYPEVDLLGSRIVKRFKAEYAEDTNVYRETIQRVVNRAVQEIARRGPLEKARFPVEGPETYAEMLSARVTERLDGGARAFEECAARAMAEDRFPDQFRAAIYGRIMENRDSLFRYDIWSFSEGAYPAIAEAVGGYAEGHPEIGEVDVGSAAESILQTEAFAEAHRRYRGDVDRLMEGLEPLGRWGSSRPNIVERVLGGILRGGMLAAECVVGLEPYVGRICEEFADSISATPYSGFTEFPAEGDFPLNEDGSVREALRVSARADPAVTVLPPDPRESTHLTSLRRSDMSAFSTVIPVRVRDSFAYGLETSGLLMRGLGIADSAAGGRVSLDLEVKVPVVSAWRLFGVDYTETATVADDLARVAAAALEPVLEPLRKAMRVAQEMFAKVRDAVAEAGNKVAEHMAGLYEGILRPLERLRSAVEGRLGSTFVQSLKTMLDITKGSQKVHLNLAGFAITLEFDAETLGRYTKSLVRAEMATGGDGRGVSAYIDVKARGHGPYTPVVVGGFAITRDGWSLSGDIDPTMETTGRLLTVSGTVHGISVDAVMPDLVQYREAGVALSDVPGLGAVLSNLPSPVPGTRLAVDAGLSLKYAAPVTRGVLINEFESNPEGGDADNEWAEIVNLTSSPVDLSGWTVVESAGGRAHSFPDGAVLQPGSRTVVRFGGSFLMNRSESLALYDPDGRKVDSTPPLKDGANDSRTWQRGFDGSTEWVFHEGTPGERNRGGLLGKDGMIPQQAAEMVKNAAAKAMGEMKKARSMEALGELFRRAVLYAVDDGIGRLASCLVEATAYVRVGIGDASSSADVDFMVYLRVGERFAGDMLRFVAGRALELFLHYDDPYKVDLGTAAAEDVYLGVSVFAAVSAPSFLGRTGEEVDLGVDVSCNIASIGAVFGKEWGVPNVAVGVVLRHCPSAAVPPALGADPSMLSDLWLLRVSFRPAGGGARGGPPPVPGCG